MCLTLKVARRRTEPVLYLHGIGGAGRWEAYHMALGTVTLTYAPQLPGWQEGRPPDGIGSVQDYAAVVQSCSTLRVLTRPSSWAIPSADGLPCMSPRCTQTVSRA